MKRVEIMMWMWSNKLASVSLWKSLEISSYSSGSFHCTRIAKRQCKRPLSSDVESFMGNKNLGVSWTDLIWLTNSNFLTCAAMWNGKSWLPCRISPSFRPQGKVGAGGHLENPEVLQQYGELQPEPEPRFSSYKLDIWILMLNIDMIPDACMKLQCLFATCIGFFTWAMLMWHCKFHFQAGNHFTMMVSGCCRTLLLYLVACSCSNMPNIPCLWNFEFLLVPW